MNKTTVATAVAAGLTAGALGLAGPATAAPSGPGDAQQIISQLEADGNRVVVNKLGTSPLTEAEVVAIRPGADIREWVWDADHDDNFFSVVGKVYYVTVR